LCENLGIDLSVTSLLRASTVEDERQALEEMVYFDAKRRGERTASNLTTENPFKYLCRLAAKNHRADIAASVAKTLYEEIQALLPDSDLSREQAILKISASELFEKINEKISRLRVKYEHIKAHTDSNSTTETLAVGHIETDVDELFYAKQALQRTLNLDADEEHPGRKRYFEELDAFFSICCNHCIE